MGAAWGLGSGREGRRGGAAEGPAGAVNLPLLDEDGERRQGATSAATGRGGAAGRAGRPSVGRWGARGGQARSGGRAMVVVEARGDRGARAAVGRAGLPGSGRLGAQQRAHDGGASGDGGGGAGRPGSGQPARAAAGARRRGAWNIAM
ncbi:uncharacterized protein [Miscanthus floridulus]|uniref:uncharacterized protein n=1 Tax=Miscanthus floridulus TaxID=154761 RepID=UPI0034595F50